MAAKIHELRAKLAALVADANAALETVQAKAAAENRELTVEERAAQDAFDTKIEAARSAYDIEATKNSRLALLGGADAPTVQVSGVSLRSERDPAHGFQTPRDLMLAVINDSGHRSVDEIADERLRPLAVREEGDRGAKQDLAFVVPSAFAPAHLATVGSDEQGTYDNRYGGFAVPTSRMPGMLQVGFEGDPTAGLTRSIPMATPSVEIMARTDKDHTTSVAGGFTVARRAEAAAAADSRMQLEMITLKAASLFGLAFATEELLSDSAISFIALIEAGFRDQFGSHILEEKLNGLGGDQYTGALTAGNGSLLTISKETSQQAGTIVYENTLKMASQCWEFGRSVWLANHNTRPQLMTLALVIGTGGVPVYQPSPVAGMPDRLHGRPVLYSEHPASVGTVGDLILGVWSEYLEGIYQPIQSASSVHVRFVNHEQAFKLWVRNCGAPWWRAKLTPKRGSQLSPFVVLQTRS